ncbi:hypothetical protein [uncultured Mucilaginibacter sp.]|uniref:hypothetical protein n=1 Tax=uncultured Mucilaginibacter sp. TaxID=797541 RepID=UPI0025D844AC|nr:hypothetical protein [uncultured Mucilaginibacter sp.]
MIKYVLVCLLFLGLYLNADSQTATTAFKLDSLISSEIRKINLSHGVIVYKSSLANLKKELKSIEMLEDIHFKKVHYHKTRNDSLTYQVWTSAESLNATPKIELYVQSGTFTDKIDNEKNSASNKLSVEHIRITRLHRPYIIELITCTKGPLTFLQVDKKKCEIAYEDALIGIGNAYALLEKNVKGQAVQ